MIIGILAMLIKYVVLENEEDVTEVSVPQTHDRQIMIPISISARKT